VLITSPIKIASTHNEDQINPSGKTRVQLLSTASPINTISMLNEHRINLSGKSRVQLP
jgi:hypothetical protein